MTVPTPFACADGAFVPRAGLGINPSDFGFARGVTLSELVRVYGGAPFRLAEHMQRLADGARLLGISLPHTLPELDRLSCALIAHHGYAHSVIKFYLTAGECGITGPSLVEYADFTPHLLILEEQVKQQPPDAPYGLEIHRRGRRLKTVPFIRDMPMVKSINYMAAFYATRVYAGPDWDDILYTHPDGYVTETSLGNIFCVLDGVLCTPARGMLHGVTRQVLLELAAQLNIPASVRDLTPADLVRATEAFTTGSYTEMMPACRIDTHALPTTTEGPVYAALRSALTRCIAAETGKAGDLSEQAPNIGRSML